MNSALSSTFSVWSHSHLAALALIIALSGTIVAAYRWKINPRTWDRIRIGLAVVLLLGFLAGPVRRALWSELPWPQLAPLHLCDVSYLMVTIAMFTRRRLPFEFAYYFGVGGTLQALLTPDLALDFPSYDYFAFFAGHGAILIGVTFLMAIGRIFPRPDAVLRMLLAGNAWLAVAGFYNALADTNFGYLSAKPPNPSLLDRLGPWPYYLIWMELLGVATICLLDVPFQILRRLRRTSGPAPGIDPPSPVL